MYCGPDIDRFWRLRNAVFGLFPSEITTLFSGWSSLIFLVVSLVYFIFLVFKNKEKITVKYSGYRFYMFTFGAIPLLISYATGLFYCSISRGVPDLLNMVFVEEKVSTVKVYDKRVWGKHNNRYELYLSGFYGGTSVSKSTYTSVEKGQEIEIHVSRSSLGTRVGF